MGSRTQSFVTRREDCAIFSISPDLVQHGIVLAGSSRPGVTGSNPVLVVRAALALVLGDARPLTNGLRLGSAQLPSCYAARRCTRQTFLLAIASQLLHVTS